MKIELDNTAKFIPAWIMQKNLDQNQLYAVRAEGENPDVVRETEKAVLVAWFTEYGKVEMWCPKSVLKDEETVKQEAEDAENRFVAGCERYAKLVASAKSLGLAVRNRMNTITIWDKADQAGKRAELEALMAQA